MPLFLPYFLSSLLPFSFFLFISFLLLYHCGFFPASSLSFFSSPFIYVYLLIGSMGFLLFAPKASPTTFGVLWAFLQDYSQTHWLLGHYFYLECACCITPLSRTKLICFVCPLTFVALPEWIKVLVLLSTYLYSMHQMVLTLCLPLSSVISSQQGIFSKRSFGRNSKIDHFSPYHQTTSFESLDCGPTPPILTRYKLMVLQPLCVHSTTLYVCLLLLPRHFCRSYHVSLCYVSLVFALILYGMKGVDFRAYIVSSYFLISLGIILAEVPAHFVHWALALIASLLTMPIGLLAVTRLLGSPSLFSWVSMAHLLYSYLLLCSWAYWPLFLLCWPIGLFIYFLGLL